MKICFKLIAVSEKKKKPLKLFSCALQEHDSCNLQRNVSKGKITENPSCQE